VPDAVEALIADGDTGTSAPAGTVEGSPGVTALFTGLRSVDSWRFPHVCSSGRGKRDESTTDWCLTRGRALRRWRGEDAEVVAGRVVQVGEDQPVLAGGGR
jgi:hypothetical protein